MRWLPIGLSAVVILAALVWCGSYIWPWSATRAEVGDEPAELTYLCTETGELVVAPPQATPAVNAKTGRSTLVQALYCPDCRKWYPAPPKEAQDRQPQGPLCPTHRRRLLVEVPAPGESSSVDFSPRG